MRPPVMFYGVGLGLVGVGVWGLRFLGLGLGLQWGTWIKCVVKRDSPLNEC